MAWRHSWLMTVFKAIIKLNQAGTTILLVEQNVFLALAHSNRGYVLEEGRMSMTGEGKVLLNDNYIKTAYLGI